MVNGYNPQDFSYFHRGENLVQQVDALKDIVHKYEEIHFHLILFPVADKDAIVEEFLKLATFYRK